MVRLLMEHPAIAVDEWLTTDGTTALHAAAGPGHVEIVKWLLFKAADATRKDADGVTPFMAACAGGHTDAAAAVLTYGIVYTERQPGPVAREIVLATDKRGQCAAFHAATSGHKHVLKWLYGGADLPDSLACMAALNPKAAPTDLAEMKGIRGALLDRAHNSYHLLPDYSRERGLGPERSAAAYLVAAALLAIVTSVGFLTPPGGYFGNLNATSTNAQLYVILAFFVVNALSFFWALATMLLSIRVLAPSDRRMDPLTVCRKANQILAVAAVTLLLAVLFAALGVAAAVVYPSSLWRPTPRRLPPCAASLPFLSCRCLCLP